VRSTCLRSLYRLQRLWAGCSHLICNDAVHLNYDPPEVESIGCEKRSWQELIPIACSKVIDCIIYYKMLHLLGNPHGPSLSFSSAPCAPPAEGLVPFSSILIFEGVAAAGAGSSFA
jgi:hypothetical protein